MPVLVVGVLTFGSVAVLEALTGPSASGTRVARETSQAEHERSNAAGQRPAEAGHLTLPAAHADVRLPVSVRIPAVGVRAAVEPLHLDRSGRLQPPRDPSHAGWWTGGPVPGDLGAAVLAGHLDSRAGPALFWRLSQLRAGDAVQVRRGDGRRAAFVVDSVRTFPADRFPTQLVYGPVPDRALRLITCGGSYDVRRGRYRDNVVVFATGR